MHLTFQRRKTEQQPPQYKVKAFGHTTDEDTGMIATYGYPDFDDLCGDEEIQRLFSNYGLETIHPTTAAAYAWIEQLKAARDDTLAYWEAAEAFDGEEKYPAQTEEPQTTVWGSGW